MCRWVDFYLFIFSVLGSATLKQENSTMIRNQVNLRLRINATTKI